MTGKQKQQVISRFFTPKPKTPPPRAPDPPPSSPSPSTPPPKIAAVVSFSPAKRLRSSHLASPLKKPKLSPHTQNPVPSLLQKVHRKETPEPSSKKYTPLEQQVVELKERYPDVLLMVEVGYKYRFFGEDAEVAARVLGIYAHVDHSFMTASIPTFRLNVHVRRLVNAGYKVGVVKQTETAAIKAHGSNRLGPFCRGLSALYTKATLEAAEDMGGKDEGFGGESNYLACVVEENLLVKNRECGVESGFDVKIGVVAIEISTGEVVFGEFNDNSMRSGLEAMILSLSPAELLLGDRLSNQTKKLLLSYAGPASNVRVEHAPQDSFTKGGALAEVMTIYESINSVNTSVTEMRSGDNEQESRSSAVEVMMNMPDLAVKALALSIRHLKQFGFERILCLGAAFRPYSCNMEMSLSGNVIQHLEILRNNSDGSEAGSLMEIMNNTLTIYGSRLLRHWVTHPLCDRSMISARLDAVAELAESMGSYKVTGDTTVLDNESWDVEVKQAELNYLLSSVLTYLGRSPDLQRGITRIFYRTATASEFIAVMQAILHSGKQLQRLHVEEEFNNDVLHLKSVRSVLLRKLILTASSASMISNAAKLLSVLNKEAAEKGDLSNLIVISDGQFPEVTAARKAVQVAKERLESLIVMYQKQLRMRNLEFMSVSGTTHLIELPVDVKVPLNWVKVNSTKKTIRYQPPEVVTALDQLTLANEELIIACRTAWDGFLLGFGKYYPEFQASVQALAALDCLHSLALLSRNKNYVRPILVYDDDPVQIEICSGRHPVLETLLLDNFVPNDTNLHGDGEFCQIITGPNMGGKSCYIRQVALIAIMAQVGSFVPASSAKLHVLDGIYTRMGASDSIQKGRSTFLEELSEASLILRNCTPRSLVIIDELGRGTSTHDGVAIAYATLHCLLEKTRCMTLFVTHYPKIADIQNEFPGSVSAYHVSYLTSSKDARSDASSDYEDVTYLYKLRHGVSERSFGFKVAQLAQIPPSCINRATEMASKLEAVMSSRSENGLMQTKAEQEAEREKKKSRPCFLQSLEYWDTVYKEFLSNLRSALEEEDAAKRFQFLINARTLAKQLTLDPHNLISDTQVRQD
ncbi:DNA mismatch repair protein MSH3 [Syzygium oleosum]|uniref:DNA mismatch repair protein MSH3 n=1 Tax=Syzygium oleosum TaxID=219896 RepID=UPI0024BAD0BD|nr:DNA mismatch repair protein MSH3 [Syzygium oleosum]